jgi:hypothetical protein
MAVRYRQFVNLIVHDERRELYSMRRLGIIPHLFHESPAADAQPDATTINEKKGCLSRIDSSCNGLPRSDINFLLPPKAAALTAMHFFSLLRGQGEGCVMFAAPYRQATAYDADKQASIVMPQPYFYKPSDSIALHMTSGGAGDSPGVHCQDTYQLYVLGRDGGLGNASFEVFDYCRTGAPTVGVRRWWNWNALPSPPLVERNLPGSMMCPTAAAVVDETTILVSSVGGGAYVFDTVEGKWEKAGSWALPFHGAAEHVPELGLWFGLEATAAQTRGLAQVHHRLCAFDLSSSLSCPPVARHAWDYLDDGGRLLVAFQASPCGPRLRQVLRRHQLPQGRQADHLCIRIFIRRGAGGH